MMTIKVLSDELAVVTEDMNELCTHTRYCGDYDLDAARYHLQTALRAVNRVYAREVGVVL